MKFLSFTIHRYRAITKPVFIDLRSRSLIPIIGINECGKTTILEALLSFDKWSNEENGGHHLKDLDNLFAFDNDEPMVSAKILIERSEWEEAADFILPELTEAEKEALISHTDITVPFDEINLSIFVNLDEETKTKVAPFIPSIKNRQVRFKKIKESKLKEFYQYEIEIYRYLKKNIYKIESPSLNIDENINFLFADEIIRNAPFILYFDDFRHDVPKSIPLDQENPSEWCVILATLFQRANKDIDLYSLPKMEERRRKSAIALVQRHLNKTLTHQWQEFNLADVQAMTIALNYHSPKDDKNQANISFDIVEKDGHGEEHYFDIRDRSKGFFWFFNFVMRLEFNPNTGDKENLNILYLLDEPGSYLHAGAQTRLCRKLKKLSEIAQVIYCTHSHHLLEPNIIPINNILIADKTANSGVIVNSIFNFKEEQTTKRLAFQPIYEALQVSPTSLEWLGHKVLVVEGIYDYFAYSMFTKSKDLLVVPSVGADSMKYIISLIMASGIDYRALWDNDSAGKAAFEGTKAHFGEEEAKLRFRLLPLHGNSKKRILQNLFSGNDLIDWKTKLELPNNTNFKKIIMALYYNPQKDVIIKETSQATFDNFDNVFSKIW